jgi:hypothetical protein
MESLNIIQLIEKNSITRLSRDYENRLINKIKDNFDINQQKMFVASFYCFLNYDANKDFIVDFDNVWKWLGFSRKDHAKTVLNKHFTIDIDYQVKSFAPEVAVAKKDNDIITVFNFKNNDTKEQFDKDNRGGSNKETILLTVNSFKKFCLKAGTKKADEIHDYYIKLEQMLQETINEETDELRKQLQNKEEEKKFLENKYIDLSDKHFKLEENHKRNIYKKTRHSLKKGPCLYLLRNPKVDNEIKFGITINLNSRLSSYMTYFEPDILFIIFTNENKLLERCIKQKYKKNILCNDSAEEWIKNIDYNEIFEYIENQAKLLNLDFTIHRNIEEIFEKSDEIISSESVSSSEISSIELSPELFENEDEDEQETEHIRMKSCNRCLIEQTIDCFNKDRSKKDGYHGICKVCEKIGKEKYVTRKKSEFIELSEKKCQICNELKEISNFSRHLYNRDGYVNNCLDCAKEITNKARLRDKNENIRFKCGKCDKDYARKDTLLKHTKTCNEF